MSNHINKIMKAIQKMPENELTKNIIVPLFEHLGYKNVEFYGGINEEGKDIILWEDNKIGGIKLVVAQVKHFKFTNKASDSKSLQTVVNQLIMCFEKKLLFIDQIAYYPYEALLISTYPIDTKTLQTRFSENPDLRSRRIEIIDGNKLASLLIQNNQEIVKTILGNEIDFTSYFKTLLNNSTLLKALGFHENIVLKNIYTDIDFSLGKNTTRLFFNINFQGRKEKFSLNKDEWIEFKEIIKEISNFTNKKIIKLSIGEIEYSYQKQVNEYIKLYEEIDLLKKQLLSIKEEISSLSKKFKTDENQRIRLHIEKDDLLNNSNSEKKISQNKLSNRIKEIDLIIQHINIKEKPIIILKKEYDTKTINLKSLEDNLSEPKYNFELDGKLLSNSLKEKRDNIETNVKLFNKTEPNNTDLKIFVKDCKYILDASSKILSNKPIYDNISGDDKNIVIRKNYDKTRFKLTIDKIFNTSYNITLLGEAGAGKTTCLQMYAFSKKDDNDKLIIWAPLSQILQNWSKNKIIIDDTNDKINKDKIENFDTAIFDYLISKKININEHDFKQILQNKKSILLLDGLDEAIKRNNWLPEAVVNLTQKYIKTQVIITSRMSGNYIERLPFFTVTLMPFTDKQRSIFIKKWFGPNKKEIINKIKSHLANNKSISEITRNPLLTTTLCVLAKHGLPLPQTEIKLYNDRMKLLTGYYDNVKNIETRITTTPQNLELLAQKLAYHLHSKNIRELYYDDLENISIDILHNHLSNSEAKIAFQELIEPCNILVPMTGDGKYGFGHLRYQEHLSALEIKTNRSIDIERIITNQWWRDTLILFAQMSESIEWLITKINYRIEMDVIKEIVYLMINTRPNDEQKRIKQNITKLKQESPELFLYTEKQFDNDEDEIYY